STVNWLLLDVPREQLERPQHGCRKLRFRRRRASQQQSVAAPAERFASIRPAGQESDSGKRRLPVAGPIAATIPTPPSAARRTWHREEVQETDSRNLQSEVVGPGANPAQSDHTPNRSGRQRSRWMNQDE